MRFLLLLGLVLASNGFAGTHLPKGSSFIGLMDDGHWQGFYIADAQPEPLTVGKNLQEIAFNVARQEVYFIDVAGALKVFDLKSKEASEVTLGEGIVRVSQITSTDSGELVMISMIDGNSAMTELVVYHPMTKSFKKTKRSRFAVFEPRVSGDVIAYLSLNCVETCRIPAREVWVGGFGKSNHIQMTLERTFLSGPTHHDGRIYFAKPDGQKSAIWSVELENGKQTQLTNDHLDSAPNPTGDQLFFLRTENGATSIYYRNSSGKTHRMPLDGVKSVRDFEVKP